MASTLVKRQESKMESKSMELETVEEEKENHTPSIYGIAAARSLSKDIKQKSLHLMKVKRRHGDWGQFDLTHAWSPEDFMSEMRSRNGSGLTRDSSLAEDSLAMARPFVMEPLRIFQEHRVKPIIQQVLETNLVDHKYDPDFCKDVTVRMTEEIKERVKRLCYPRYKFVCHVTVGNVNQQDVKIVSRCAWDSVVDRFAECEFRSYHLYAVGIVFGIYCE